MPKFHVAEFVGPGHPDRMADHISNLVLELLDQKHPGCRAAIETLVTSDLVLVAGEVGADVVADVEAIKAEVSKFLDSMGYTGSSFEIIAKLKPQSQDIVTASKNEELGLQSGDQCSAVGYATNATMNMMPLGCNIARAIMDKVQELRGKDEIPALKPDAKCLVCVFDKEIQYLVLSVHHGEEHNAAPEDLRRHLYAKAVTPVLLDMGVKWSSQWIHINRTPFNIGGLDADTGATNRKTAVDAYGTAAPHGGGGLNGKDMSKVDRLLAYYLRWICVNVVMAGLCSEIEIQGYIRPGSWKPGLTLGRVAGIRDSLQWSQLAKVIRQVFDYKLQDIYDMFKKPENGWDFVMPTHSGHFGKTVYPWEQTTKIKEINEALTQIGA